jgi:hypothetical protein
MSERLRTVATRLGLALPSVDTPEAWAELAVDVFLRPPPPTRVPPRERLELIQCVAGALAEESEMETRAREESELETAAAGVHFALCRAAAGELQ